MRGERRKTRDRSIECLTMKNIKHHDKHGGRGPARADPARGNSGDGKSLAAELAMLIVTDAGAVGPPGNGQTATRPPATEAVIVAGPDQPTASSPEFINRELSWLEFNRRVL